jgi:hypothetical protein
MIGMKNSSISLSKIIISILSTLHCTCNIMSQPVSMIFHSTSSCYAFTQALGKFVPGKFVPGKFFPEENSSLRKIHPGPQGKFVPKTNCIIIGQCWMYCVGKIERPWCWYWHRCTIESEWWWGWVLKISSLHFSSLALGCWGNRIQN